MISEAGVSGTEGMPCIEWLKAEAAGKMDRLLESLFGRLDSTRGGASASGQPT